MAKIPISHKNKGGRGQKNLHPYFTHSSCKHKNNIIATDVKGILKHIQSVENQSKDISTNISNLTLVLQLNCFNFKL